jgi:molybdate transport system permease protein
MSRGDLDSLVLTLELAALSTALLLLLSTPVAWWLSRTRSRAKHAIETLVALPLVLPPTVLGFYLLIALGPRGPIGASWSALGGEPLVFSFAGLVIGSLLYSLPFVVQPIQASFEEMGRVPLEVAATVGAGPVDRFFTVALPLARRGLVVAAVLGFAHTLGEFGVVLMIGGNIPGETRVVSIAIYEHVERLDYASAHRLAAVLVGLSVAILATVFVVSRRPVQARI